MHRNKHTMTYNIALKAALIERGLRQIDVSAKAGIDNAKFSHIIRGRMVPTQDEKRRIAKVLRLPMYRLFPESESPQVA